MMIESKFMVRALRSIVAPARLCATLFVVCLAFGQARADQLDRPSLGVIRHGAWFSGGVFNRMLLEKPDFGRQPFYLKGSVDHPVGGEDDPEVAEQESRYARAGGLDYWLFGYSQPQCGGTPIQIHDVMNSALRAYLGLSDNSGMRFALNVVYACFKHWQQFVDNITPYVADTRYMRLPGGRPLIFFFAENDNWLSLMNTDGSAREKIDTLRNEVRKATKFDPYIVLMTGPSKAGSLMDATGADAITFYALSVGAEKSEVPFARLVALQRRFMERFYETGRPVVPSIQTGWDTRSLILYGPKYQVELKRNPNANWVARPTADEIKNLFVSTLREFDRQRSLAEYPNTVIVYAWNELLEGGWLVPTIGEGTSRLDAVSGALSTLATQPTTPTRH